MIQVGGSNLITIRNHWLPERDGRTDAVLSTVTGAISILGLVALAICPVFLQPSEDATILFRYADNLARTGSISFNLNGPHTEGATDFLWMLLLSTARLAGMAPYTITGAISAVAVVATVLLLFRIAGAEFRIGAASLLVLALLLCPQTLAAATGFSVFVFGATIVVTTYFYLRQEETALAISAVILCLLRPDGAVFAIPLLGFAFLQSANKRHTAAICGLVFALPLLLYFVWRWSYFGEFLPLPFLVKSDAARWHGVLIEGSASAILVYCALAAPIIWFACGRRVVESANLRLLTALIIVPSAFYAEIRLDQNVADRFLYYIIIGVAVLVAFNARNPEFSRKKVMLATVACLAVLFPWKWAPGALSLARQDVSNVGQILLAIRGEDLSGRMAVTEAGWLPYYTGWQATDLWGLNTAEFAHHLVQPAQIPGLGADLIVVHSPQTQFDCSLNHDWQVPYQVRNWSNMVANVIVGASLANYELYMVPEENEAGHRIHLIYHNYAKGEGEYYCYFVSAQYAERDKLIEILRQHGALTASEFEALRK